MPLYTFSEGDNITFNYRACNVLGICSNNVSVSYNATNSMPLLTKKTYSQAEVVIPTVIQPDDNLSCETFNYFDPDGDAITNTYYKWYRNSMLISTDKTISIQNETPGTNYYCSVMVENAYHNSTWYNSSSVAVTDYPVITINTTNEAHVINRRLFGKGTTLSSYRTHDDIAWNTSSNSFIPDKLNVTKDIGFTSVRYGGCQANYFMWDKMNRGESYYERPCSGVYRNATPKINMSVLFDFAKEITPSGEVVLTINMVNNGSNSTPTIRPNESYSADFVNWTNIQNNYNVTYWELGNELYFDIGGNPPANATEYAELGITHCNAMKEVDPTIKCGIVVRFDNTRKVNGKVWNEEVLRIAGNYTDFLIPHYYIGSDIPNTRKINPNKAVVYDNIWLPEDGTYNVSIYAMGYNTSIRIQIDNMDILGADNFWQEFPVTNYRRSGYYKKYEIQTNLTRGRHTITIRSVPDADNTRLYVGNLRYRLLSNDLVESIPVKSYEETFYGNAFTADKQIEYSVKGLENIVSNYTNRSEMPIMVTEFLCHSRTETYPHWGNAETQWYGCSVLGNVIRYQQFMRTSEIEGAYVWLAHYSSGTPSNLYDAEDQTRPPQYFAHQLISKYSGRKFLNATVTGSPTFNGTRSYEQNIPYLEFVTTKSTDDSELFINVVNKHLTRNITARINISEDYRVYKKSKIYKLWSDAIDGNNENGTEDIKIEIDIIDTSNLFGYTFPKHSVTTIALREFSGFYRYVEGDSLAYPIDSNNTLIEYDNVSVFINSTLSNYTHRYIENLELEVYNISLVINVSNCDIDYLNYTSSTSAFYKRYNESDWSCSNSRMNITIEGVEPGINTLMIEFRATPPTIRISSPQNITYSTYSVDLNYSVNDSSGVDWIGYSLDGQDNVTLIANTTLTNLSDSQHTITVYANDTAGNTNSSTVSFTIDTIPPTYSNLTPQNNSNTSDSGQDISIIITDNGSGVNENSILMKVEDITYDTNSTKLIYDTNTSILTYHAVEGEFTDGQVVDVTVNAKDTAGNQMEVTWSFTVDTTIYIDSCTVISEPGIYKLTQDIHDSNASTCINIQSSDVIFDGQGYTIDGIDSYTIGIDISQQNNVKIQNTKLTDWTAGIVISNSSNNTITDNNVSSNYYGIYLSFAASTMISNNDASNNNCGITIDYLSNDNKINNNSMNSNDCGIGILGLSYNNTISNNTLSSNTHGIKLDSSLYNTITDNDAEDNVYGIYLNESAYIAITNNNASHNYYGVYLDMAENNTIFDNNLSYNTDSGIILDILSNNNILFGNMASHNNFSGIGLIGSSENKIYNNILSDNVGYGIGLLYSNVNILANNNARSNGYGIYINESTYNLVYNNYLYNSVNAIDLSPGNFWNVTLTPGTNIVGGPYIGGNYYSDYTGSDTDGDGIGEDPYSIYLSGIDYLPLVSD